MKNKEFAAKNIIFREACRLAGRNPSARQARKYRQDLGNWPHNNETRKFKKKAKQNLSVRVSAWDLFKFSRMK